MLCLIKWKITKPYPKLRNDLIIHLQMTVRAGRDISKGEHLSIMYTHSLWGTQARRAHLFETKKFWCFCPRCKDATEFSKFSLLFFLFLLTKV